MTSIKRRLTETVAVGDVKLGSNHSIKVQSMTNTQTAKVDETVAQVKELVDAGSEMVRLTVNDAEAAQAIPKIIFKLNSDGYDVPLIGDFHYNGHILLTKYPETAALLAKYRINPGNVGRGEKRDENFVQMIQVAIDNNKPVRIGINWGSLDQELFTSMMEENSKKKLQSRLKKS